MFEQYALSVAVALTILMLTALVVLAVVLASMDRRLVYGVVVTMGMTSVITACLVGLVAMFLAYALAGKNCKGDTPAAVAAAEHATAGEGPRATLPEAYPHERSDVSANPLMDASRDTEGD